jgi:hypothetical protein
MRPARLFGNEKIAFQELARIMQRFDGYAARGGAIV